MKLVLFALYFAAFGVYACNTDLGTGKLKGYIDAPKCWRGAFDLAPDFFAAAPYRRQLTIRVQRGSDAYVNSDGVSILIDDVDAIRGSLGQAMRVGLSPEVTPPGVLMQPELSPPLVHLSLYLQRTCRTENVSLYAVSQVRLGDDGNCSSAPIGTREENCDPSKMTAPTGKSTMVFRSLFNNDTTSTKESELLSDADVDVYLADPREACPGANVPPPPCRGHLTGNFRFLFERGKPAQAFP